MRYGEARPFAKTFDDALSILAKNAWLTAREHATVCALPIELPDGAVIAVVSLVGPCGSMHAVTLPNAVAFTAKSTTGERSTYDIARLDLASVDYGGNVGLLDGSHLQDVELVAARTRRIADGDTQLQFFSNEDEDVLVQVLDALGLFQDCLADFGPGHPKRKSALDYALVAALGRNKRLPSMKVIQNKLLARRKELQRCDKLQGAPEVRPQTLRNILARAGLRRPRSGRRARPDARAAQNLP